MVWIVVLVLIGVGAWAWMNRVSLMAKILGQPERRIERRLKGPKH